LAVSGVGVLTSILDATVLVIAVVYGIRNEQAKLTFAMARHAVVDLAQVVNARYDPGAHDRLSPEEFSRLRKALEEQGLHLAASPEYEQTLADLRGQYEPYAQAIARNLFITLPPWIHPEKKKDNWQAGPWDRAIQARSLGQLGHMAHRRQRPDDHF
jgi:hypothetical protein